MKPLTSTPEWRSRGRAPSGLFSSGPEQAVQSHCDSKAGQAGVELRGELLRQRHGREDRDHRRSCEIASDRIKPRLQGQILRAGPLRDGSKTNM